MDDLSQKENNQNDKPLSPREKAEIKDNIYKHLQLPATSGSIRFFPGGRNGWLPRTVAAAVLLSVLSVPLYFWLKPSDGNKLNVINNYTSFREITTGAGDMKRITLEDSTVVLLNANSKLRFNSDFTEGSRREVELEGNAFFTVKKDRLLSPFVIHARSLSVTVLGTELNVSARSEQTQVELASGKVKVERKGNAGNTVYLQPGEKIMLDTAKQVFQKTKIDVERYFAWTKGKWNFHQTSLDEIASLIREYYGSEIVFNNQSARHMRIDAVLPVSGLQNLVSVIEKTLQIKIEILRNQLIVQ